MIDTLMHGGYAMFGGVYARRTALRMPIDTRGVQTGGFSLGFGCEVFVLKLDGKLGFGLNYGMAFVHGAQKTIPYT
jgi:hypothetical protein